MWKENTFHKLVCVLFLTFFICWDELNLNLSCNRIRKVFEEHNYFDCVTLIANLIQCCNVPLSGSAVTRGHSCRLLTE